MGSVADVVFLAAFGLAVVLAWCALGQPGRLRRKLLALAALAAFVPTGLFATVELLGRPKPVALEPLSDFREGVIVLAFEIREGEAIYLWVRRPGIDEPRAYVLPWSIAAAMELAEAKEVADQVRTELIARLADSEEGEPVAWRDAPLVFHPAPQVPLPVKPAPEDDEGAFVLEDEDG